MLHSLLRKVPLKLHSSFQSSNFEGQESIRAEQAGPTITSVLLSIINEFTAPAPEFWSQSQIDQKNL